MSTAIFLIIYLIVCFSLAFFLCKKYPFFHKAKGFLAVLAAGFLAVILHNLIYALFFYQQGGDEPVVFILALLLLGTGFWIFYFWLMRKILWDSKLRQKFGIAEREYWMVSAAAGLSLAVIVIGIFSLDSWQRLQGVQKQYWWVSAVGGAEQMTEESSFYCLDQGGELELRRSGEVYRRFCVFEDQSECETRDFYLRKCEKGEEPSH